MKFVVDRFFNCKIYLYWSQIWTYDFLIKVLLFIYLCNVVALCASKWTNFQLKTQPNRSCLKLGLFWLDVEMPFCFAIYFHLGCRKVSWKISNIIINMSRSNWTWHFHTWSRFVFLGIHCGGRQSPHNLYLEHMTYSSCAEEVISLVEFNCFPCLPWYIHMSIIHPSKLQLKTLIPYHAPLVKII